MRLLGTVSAVQGTNWAHDLPLLVVGFGLTTVLGGALGYFFQRSSWNHQHKVQQSDDERERASKAFDEISRLLDKRLHRMRLLNAAIRGSALSAHARTVETAAAPECSSSDAPENSPPPTFDWTDQLKQARDNYRLVLLEWNDNLNRTLAIAEVYFGRQARKDLEGLYEVFVSLGRAFDLTVRLIERQDPNQIRPRFTDRLVNLGHRVYSLNVQMLSLLRDGKVGSLAPSEDGDGISTTARASVVQLGDTGDEIRRLQRQLRGHGYEMVVVDGIFGLDTYRALEDFQRAQHLSADGIVGPKTWQAL